MDVTLGGYLGVCQVLKICATIGLSGSFTFVNVTQSPIINLRFRMTIPISNRSPRTSTPPMGIRCVLLPPPSKLPPSIDAASFANPRLINSESSFFLSSSDTFVSVCYQSVYSERNHTCRVVASVNICDSSALYNLALLNIKFISATKVSNFL